MKLSHSGISTYFLCPRQFKHKYIDKRVPVYEDDALELVYGKVFHKGLETGDITVFEHSGLSEIWKTIGAVVLECYFLHYADQDIKISERERPWNNNGIRGVLDGTGQDQEKKWFILETKTTKALVGDPDHDYWKRKELDQQVSIYLWANRGYEYVLYDVVRRPPMRLKARESMEDFRERVFQYVLENKYDMFVRKKFYRTKEQLVEMGCDLVDVEDLIATGKFPKNTANCFAHRRRCVYIGVCKLECKLSDNKLFKAKKDV